MQNFFRNAKQALEVGQDIAKKVSEARAQQQQAAQTSATRSRSRSRSRSNDSKKEPKKLQNVDINALTRIDSEQCFSVMHCKQGLYHVVYVEGRVSVLMIGDRERAISLRDQLNRFKTVAKAAYKQHILNVFADQMSTSWNWPEICLACFLNLPDAVDLLCKDDALVAINLAVPETGLLPLHICIQKANLPLAKKLISYGADVRKCDLSTQNCLHYAVSNGFTFVKALHDAKPEHFVEALDQGNSDDYTPFHMALKQDSTDTNQLVKFLIKCGANSSLVNVDIAGLGVSLRALNALLEEDRNAMTGDPIEPYKTIFHGKFDRQYLKVAHHWNPKIVDQPNEDSRTPLHCAVIQEDVERAVYLLSFGASVRAVGKRGNSPLHLAVSKNNEALVKILLCFDADYELKNKDGQAPVEMKSTAAVAKIFTQLIKSKQSSMAADSGQDLSDIIHFKQEKAVDYQEALGPEVRSKTIRLLSLDGGGIRGLCIGLMLLRIEKETRSKKIFDYFDWIAGTSTGAIFALSLAEGFSVLDCMRFYLRLKDEVFPGTRPHDPTPLENFLKECYGNKNMDQVKNGKRVVVTTTKADTNPPKLVMLRSYEMPKLVTLSIPPSEIKMWKAARCSSAAPTYFPSVDKIYLDGGLIANNPAPDLIGDVHHYNLQREYDGKDPLTVCCLLSLGTGRLPDQKLDGIDLEVSKGSGIVSFFSNMSNVYKNIKNLGNVFMEQLATSDGAVVERSRSWAHSLNIPYYRYTPQLEEECSLNTQSNEEVIKLMWTSKLYAESRSQAEIQQIIRLLRAD